MSIAQRTTAKKSQPIDIHVISFNDMALVLLCFFLPLIVWLIALAHQHIAYTLNPKTNMRRLMPRKNKMKKNERREKKKNWMEAGNRLKLKIKLRASQTFSRNWLWFGIHSEASKSDLLSKASAPHSPQCKWVSWKSKKKTATILTEITM